MSVRSSWGGFATGAVVGASALAMVVGVPLPGQAPGIQAELANDRTAMLRAADQGSHASGTDVDPSAVDPLETAPIRLRKEVRSLERLRDDLRRKTDELAAQLAATSEADLVCPPPAPTALHALRPVSGSLPPPQELVAEAALPRFRTDRLSAGHLDGFSVPAVADAFHDANREIAMLESAAYQQGWGNDPTLDEQRLTLRHSLQDYLGPEAYLAGLYATGRPNRLVVTRVTAGTDAALQGLQRGDVLLSVDGYRLFDKVDFAAMTGSLTPGSPVQLEILRDGQSLRLLVDDPGASIQVFAQRVDPDNYYAAK